MSKKRTKRKTLSDQLRDLIEDNEKSRYRISIETGIDKSQLSRFMHGTGRITNDTLDKLGECLNLEVKVRKGS